MTYKICIIIEIESQTDTHTYTHTDKQARRQTERRENRKKERWSTLCEFVASTNLYIYNSVLTCRQNIINSSVSTPLNATKIAVKKVGDVDVCMFGPEL